MESGGERGSKGGRPNGGGDRLVKLSTKLSVVSSAVKGGAHNFGKGDSGYAG